MDLVLIPAYEPDAQLVALTQQLKAKGFAVLVVNDGSGEKYEDVVTAVRNHATVIKLEKNSGKGAALKAGMRHIRDQMPECEYFITCDADGQHRVEDVERVRDRLHKGDKFVLTVRNRKKDIPLRSKVGNSLSRFVYALLSNRYLSDNQSGLRGFARVHIDWLIDVEKDNYDYEMNMLYYATKKNIKISTIPIEAIYIGNNESSHFNPVGDTVKIYKSLFRLALGTFIAFFVSEMLVAALSLTVGYRHLVITLPTVAAISYLVNIVLSKYLCFRHTPCYDQWKTLIYTVFWYVFYTLGCMLFRYALPEVPLWLAFNIVYAVCIPLRYCLHKFIFIASRTRE